MSNVIGYILDVLATSPEEINRIAARLKQPSPELLDSVAGKSNCERDEIAQSLAKLIAFEPAQNLFHIHESVNKGRRFKNRFRCGYVGIVKSHIFEVSAEHPNAVFLLEHYDQQLSYSGKRVIYGGKVVQEIFDGEHQSQAVDWVLLDIFAPFRAEWLEGLKVGSLWAKWVKDVGAAVEELRKTVLPDEALDADRDLILNQKPAI